MCNPVIVIPTYNRPDSLKRLLFSIENANFIDYPTLIFSIDGGGSDEILNIANNFPWPGHKVILSHKVNLGLKEHILKCGDLSEKYESIILLEEDLFVSKYFYAYAKESLNYYKENDAIGGISLYQYEYIENEDLPFKPLVDGFDTYFIQTASSWGQAWSKKQWLSFKQWYNHNKTWDNSDERLPLDVLNWPETSWKKYYIKYLVATNKYFVFPRVSLTTNFGDPGTNNGYKNNLHQVNLLIGDKKWHFASLELGIKYDVQFEVENLIDFISDNNKTNNLQIEMNPLELNVVMGIMDLSTYNKQLEILKIENQDYKLLNNLSDKTIRRIQNEMPSLKRQVFNQIKYLIFKK